MCRYVGPPASSSAHVDAGGVLLAIGRRKRCGLRLLRDLEVSSVHAELRLVGDGDGDDNVALRDVKSTNGSKLNGQPLEPMEDRAVADGDLLSVGRSIVRVLFVPHEAKQGSEDQKKQVFESKTEEKEVVVEKRKPEDDVVVVSEEEKAKSEENLSDDRKTEEEDDERPQEPEKEPRGQLVESKRTADDDVFESPKGMAKRVEQVAASKRVTCMVCGRWLGMLDVMEQQLHINACLDGRQEADPSSLLLHSRGEQPTRRPGKKRKRRTGADPEQDQLTLALVLSKSMVGADRQADMQLSLVRQELEQVDAQMAKLAKKRVALIKSMAKLEKKAAKLRKSQVRPPEEVRALLQLERALDAIFPRDREIADVCETKRRRPTRRRWANGEERTLESPRSPSLSQDELRDDKEVDSQRSGRVPFWDRASQKPMFDAKERQVYYNSVLLPFLPPEGETGDISKTVDVPMDVDGIRLTEKSVPESRHGHIDQESEAPAVVKRAFPRWEDNMAFICDQEPNALRDAIDTVKHAQESGNVKDLLQSMMTQPDVSDDGLEEHERQEVCAYLEATMQQVLDSKTREFGGDVGALNAVIELLDNEESYSDGAFRRSRKGLAQTQLACGHESDSQDEGVISISDSDSESDTERAPYSEGQGSLNEKEDSDSGIPATATEPATPGEVEDKLESEEAPVLKANKPAKAPLDNSEDSNSVLDEGSTHIPVTLTNRDDEPMSTSEEDCTDEEPRRESNSTTDPEARILETLRANEQLYERVLLLQPLSLPEFISHLQSAGVKSSRQLVASTLDRNGITFHN